MARLLMAISLLAAAASSVLAGLEISDTCLTEQGLQRDAAENFFKSKAVETDDRNMKCFISCEMLRQNWMSPDGTIIASPNKPIPPDFMPVVQECRAQVTETDLCDRAFAFHRCIITKHR